MPTVIDALLVSLGFQVKPEGLEGFAKLTERAKTGMLTLGAAAGGAFLGIEKLIHGAASRLGGIQEFSEQMGISARTVAALGKVADENGSSLEGMEGGLRGLTMMAIQADRHLGRGAKVFKTFGLNARDGNHHLKSAEVLLGEVADKMEKLKTPGERNLLGSRMGFDPAMIALLSKGRAHLALLRADAEKAIPFGEKDYEAGLQAERGFKKAASAVALLRDRIAVQLFPAVNEMLAKFVAWTKDPEKIRTLTRYMKDVVEVAKWITQHFGAILKVAGTITALKAGLWFFHLGKDALGAGKAVFGLVKAFGWLRAALMTGILGALVLLGQDLWTFYHGGRSVTGWMVNKFPGGVDVMVAAINVLGGALLALAAKSGPIGLAAAGIGGFVIAGVALYDAWNPVMQWFGEQWDKLADKVRTFAKVVAWPAWLILKVTGGSANVDAVFGADRGGATGTRKTLQDAAKYDEKDFNARMAAFRQRNVSGGGVLAGDSFSMLAGVRGAGTVHNETHVGAINLHVKGGEKWTPADALRHAQEIKRALALEGLMSGADQNRTNTHNAQSPVGL